MHFVALDIATATGVARWKPGLSRPLLATIHLSGESREVGRPMEKLRQYLADLHAVEPITHLLFEAAIAPRNGRTTIDTIRKLMSLCAMAEWFGHRIEAETRQVEQGDWRKHFLGRGTGKSEELKQLSKQTARAYGWNIANDHEADASGILDYGLACFKVDRPWRDAKLMQAAQLWGVTA